MLIPKFLCAVIKDFCKQLGADTKQVQGLIRLAKKNGEKSAWEDMVWALLNTKEFLFNH